MRFQLWNYKEDCAIIKKLESSDKFQHFLIATHIWKCF